MPNEYIWQESDLYQKYIDTLIDYLANPTEEKQDASFHSALRIATFLRDPGLTEDKRRVFAERTDKLLGKDGNEWASFLEEVYCDSNGGFGSQKCYTKLLAESPYRDSIILHHTTINGAFHGHVPPVLKCRIKSGVSARHVIVIDPKDATLFPV